MSYARGVRVFNQFTFFSVLIPGLFAVAFVLPVAPPSVFGLDAGWVLVLVVGLSFGVGMTLHIASESFERWMPGAYRPTERMRDRLNALAADAGSAEAVTLMTEFVTLYDERFNTDVSGTVATTESVTTGVDPDPADLTTDTGLDTGDLPFSRADGKRVFQATLAELWSKNVGPIRILVTTYFLCRSMALLIPALAVGYGGFALLLAAGSIRFDPLYAAFLGHVGFVSLLVTVLVFGAAVFFHGYNRYAGYTVSYLIAGFVQHEEPATSVSAASD